MVEVISIIIAVIGLYLAYYSYLRIKGYLNLDFHFEMDGVNLPKSLLSKMESIINVGDSKIFKNTFNIYIDIKNIGYQNVTIEKIILERVAFLPNHEDALLFNLDGNRKEKMQKEIKSFLKARTFQEVNRLILINNKNSIETESFFNEKKGILHIQLNQSSITLKRQEKYTLNVSKILSNIDYEFEEKNLTYSHGQIYCIDTLGRVWLLNKKSKKLFMMYSIGLDNSYFNLIRNIK